MSGNQVFPPFQVFADEDGDPLESGFIYIGDANQNPQTNPIPAFWDAALTIPAAQPIRTIGGYPSREGTPSRIFVDQPIYSITVRNKKGELVFTLLDAQDYVESILGDDGINGGSSIIARGDQIVNSIAELRLLDKNSPSQFAFVTGYYGQGDGGGGHYYLDATDFVSADNAGTVIVAADGARWKYVDDSFTVKTFGAVGDGTTDDTAAFNAIIAYANTIGGNDFLNITGVRIAIPQGRYKITSTLTPIVKSGIDIEGAGWDATVLLLPVGQFGVFRWGDAGVTGFPVGGSMSKLKLEYLSLPDTSTCIVLINQASRIRFDDILLANIGTFLSLGTSPSATASGIFMSNIGGSCANVANIAVIDVRFGAGLKMNNVGIFAPVPIPVVGQPSLAAVNRNVFNMAVGFWDTVQVSNCIFERFDSGFAINAAAGMVYQNIFIENTIFDLHKTSGITASSALGGVVAGIRTRNSWITTWDGPAINMVGAGTHFEHDLDFYVPIAGQEALFYGLTAGRNNKFRLSIGSVNRIATASNAAMHFVSTARGFAASQCSGNDDNTGVIFPWRAQHGISVGANCEDYSITDCKVTGSADAFFTPVNSAPSQFRRIANNANANYATPSGFALNASGVPTFNQTAFVMDVDINGGTGVSIARDGVNITNKTSGVVRLDPGHSVTVTFATPPAALALIHA